MLTERAGVLELFTVALVLPSVVDCCGLVLRAGLRTCGWRFSGDLVQPILGLWAWGSRVGLSQHSCPPSDDSKPVMVSVVGVGWKFPPPLPV